jgi:hypothetical protein
MAISIVFLSIMNGFPLRFYCNQNEILQSEEIISLSEEIISL